MEKLVDVVHFLHLEIHEAFGGAGETRLLDKAFSSYFSVQEDRGFSYFLVPKMKDVLTNHGHFTWYADPDKPANDPPINHKKLGSAGLALHYANIITQIDTLVSILFFFIT